MFNGGATVEQYAVTTNVWIQGVALYRSFCHLLGTRIGEASHPGPSAAKQWDRALIAEGKAHVGDTFEVAWQDKPFVEKVLKSRPRSDNLQTLQLYFQLKRTKELARAKVNATAAPVPAPVVPPPAPTGQLQIVPYGSLGLAATAPQPSTTELPKPLWDFVKGKVTVASSAAVHSLFTRRALLVLALVVLVPTMMGTVVGACILCVLRGFGTFGATVYRHFLTGLAFNAEQLAKTFNDFEAAVLYGDTSAMTQPVNGNSEPPSSMPARPTHLQQLWTQCCTFALAFCVGKAYSGGNGR